MKPCLLLLVPGLALTLAGQELRIVDVIRRGPPPYADQDRLYRVEGEGCKGLKPGSQLDIQGRDGEKGGTLIVSEIGSNYIICKLMRRGISYPMKGDRVIISNTLDQMLTAIRLDTTEIQTVTAPQPNQHSLGVILFKVGDSGISPAGNEKLKSWVGVWGTSGRWVMAPVKNPKEADSLTASRVMALQNELRNLGVTQIDQLDPVVGSQDELPSIKMIWVVPTGSPSGRPVLPPPPALAENKLDSEEQPVSHPEGIVVGPDQPRPLGVILGTKPATGLESTRWTFGLARQSPSLTGSYDRVKGAAVYSFDLVEDLQIEKGRIAPGFFANYERGRFIFLIGTYGLNYSGNNILNRDVLIDTTKYSPGSLLNSDISLHIYELNGTFKVWSSDRAYLGADFGINIWNLDANVSGLGTLQMDPSTTVLSHTNTNIVFTFPQLGLSGGYFVLNNLSSRAYFHFMAINGSTYKRYGLDVNFLPFKRIGFRLNYEREGIDITPGSVSRSTTLRLDKNGLGFGVFFRL